MRRSTTRRGATRRRFSRRRARTAAPIIRSLDRRVRRIERAAETKIKAYTDDSGLITQGFNSSASLSATYIYEGNPKTLLINGLDKGGALQQRIGDKVLWTYAKCKIAGYFGKDCHDRSKINWAFVRIKRPNGIGWTAGIILNSIYGKVNPRAVDVPNVINTQNSWKHDFEFVKTGQIMFHPGIDSADISYEGTNVITQVVNFKLGITTGYPLDNTGDVDDMSTNALYFIAWTEDPQITTGIGAGMKIQMNGNFYFKDS